MSKRYVRLTHPLVREVPGDRSTPFRRSGWDEALAQVTAGLAAARAGRPTSSGIFSCSKATNEVNFAAQKFARSVLGTNNIDSCNRT